jgi:hypothetical protein
MKKIIVVIGVFVGLAAGALVLIRAARSTPTVTAALPSLGNRACAALSRGPKADVGVGVPYSGGASHLVAGGWSSPMLVTSESLQAAFPELNRNQIWSQFLKSAGYLAVVTEPGAVPKIFERTSVKEEPGFVTWTGTDPMKPGSILVASTGRSATLTTLVSEPLRPQVLIYTAADGKTTVETVSSKFSCAVGGDNRAADYHGELTDAEIEAVYSDGTLSGVPPTDVVEEILKGANAAAKVDVAFCYDADTLAWAKTKASDAIAYMEGLLKAELEAGNVVLAQSLIQSFQWRYIGIAQVPDDYTNADDKLTTCLSWMGSSTWAKNDIKTKGADQYVFLKGNTKGEAAGMAYTGNYNSPTSLSLSAILVQANYRVLIHELGHNFGALHDRETDKVADAAGRYNYGWMTSMTSGSATYKVGTIMSYAGYILPYYSHPNITLGINAAIKKESPYAYLPVDFGTSAIGIAADQPAAAFNAKVLEDNGQAMSMMQIAADQPPIITTQPVNSSSTAGSSLYFSAAVSGANITYQWYKDGAPITGATGISYNKTNCNAADAGNYYLVATNPNGSAQSITVTATINTPPSSSGGGAGGGGAPSDWFFAAIGFASFLRRFVWKR